MSYAMVSPHHALTASPGASENHWIPENLKTR